MKVLLDTHALLWWLAGDRRLPTFARAVLADENSTVYVSAASAWEIATKVRLGKLAGAASVAENLGGILVEQGMTPLDVTVEQALRAGRLPGPHRDPFDRMLIAQAQALDVPLMSNEALFDRYGVRRIWEQKATKDTSTSLP